MPVGLIGLLNVWLGDNLLHCDARVTPIIVWNCGRERPTGSALHLSGAGAPHGLETRMRTGQSAVRFLVACAFCCLFFLLRRGLSTKRASLNCHYRFAGGAVMSYESVSGSSVDLLTFVPQRQTYTPAGYYIWPGAAGHAIQQLFRSLCPTKSTSQGHRSMVTVRMGVCVCVCVCVWRGLCCFLPGACEI